MEEKVSVVIPVYQSEHTIERCVHSILDGTYKNIQIILVEDCSKDNSWGKCRELSEQSEKVIAVRNDCNHGVSYTRNQGIKIADGKYLIFVDSDDWVEDNFIESLVKVQEQYQPVLSLCGYHNHEEANGGSDELFLFAKKGQIPMNQCLSELYEKRLAQTLWNKIFNLSKIHDSHILFEENISIGEDFRFILDYLELFRPEDDIFLLNEPLYHYMRDNPSSLMAAPELAKIDELLKNTERLQRICGYDENHIREYIAAERQHQFDVYGYIVCHNSHYTKKEKKEMLKKIIGSSWQQVYQKNRYLMLKEKIWKMLARK